MHSHWCVVFINAVSQHCLFTRVIISDIDIPLCDTTHWRCDVYY